MLIYSLLLVPVIMFCLFYYLVNTNEISLSFNGVIVNNNWVVVLMSMYPILTLLSLAFMRIFFVKVDQKHTEILDKNVEKTKLAHEAALEKRSRHKNEDYDQ